VKQKTSNANPRQPATSKSLKANAGPKVIQRILKQNLRKAIITTTSRGQQREAIHKPLQAKDAKKNFTN